MGAHKLVSTLAAIAAASLGFIVLPAPGAAQPCASGTDVRNLDDSGVSASLKNQILGTPGQIISNTSASYPSGKLVVIRAALQDAPVNPAADTAYINEIFFGTVAGEKNIHGYYNTNSYGKLNVSSGSVPDWFTLNKKITDYSGGIEGNATFLQDVLKKANVNWSTLDSNHDHTISIPEAQIIILVPNALPGSGFASTRGVTAGSVATPNGTFTFANRKIIIFSLKALADPQYDVNPIRALAAIAHELGHAFFNLPDRYGANTGTGEYDMMGSANSSTWVHYTMHDKVKIGWIQPKIVQGHLGQCLLFVPSELTASALIIVPITSFLTSPLEYWIIENRNKQYDGGEGYDDDLPDKGLAVWYNSVGTFVPSNQDDVRLIDFSKPTQNPLSYNNPGSNALFTVNLTTPSRSILNRNGQWNLLWFENVSDVNLNYSGLFMFAEF
jgi:M6 family metalloprotease-like protein